MQSFFVLVLNACFLRSALAGHAMVNSTDTDFDFVSYRGVHVFPPSKASDKPEHERSNGSGEASGRSKQISSVGSALLQDRHSEDLQPGKETLCCLVQKATLESVDPYVPYHEKEMGNDWLGQKVWDYPWSKMQQGTKAKKALCRLEVLPDPEKEGAKLTTCEATAKGAPPGVRVRLAWLDMSDEDIANLDRGDAPPDEFEPKIGSLEYKVGFLDGFKLSIDEIAEGAGCVDTTPLCNYIDLWDDLMTDAIGKADEGFHQGENSGGKPQEDKVPPVFKPNYYAEAPLIAMGHSKDLKTVATGGVFERKFHYLLKQHKVEGPELRKMAEGFAEYKKTHPGFQGVFPKPRALEEDKRKTAQQEAAAAVS